MIANGHLVPASPAFVARITKKLERKLKFLRPWFEAEKSTLTEHV
jgi:hypothetical protein